MSQSLIPPEHKVLTRKAIMKTAMDALEAGLTLDEIVTLAVKAKIKVK